MLCFGFFLFSVSEHSFILTASRRLFFARTSEKNLFVKDSKLIKPSRVKYLSKDSYPTDASAEDIKELDKH